MPIQHSRLQHQQRVEKQGGILNLQWWISSMENFICHFAGTVKTRWYEYVTPTLKVFAKTLNVHLEFWRTCGGYWIFVCNIMTWKCVTFYSQFLYVAQHSSWCWQRKDFSYVRVGRGSPTDNDGLWLEGGVAGRSRGTTGKVHEGDFTGYDIRLLTGRMLSSGWRGGRYLLII